MADLACRTNGYIYDPAANLAKGYEAAQELDVPLFCHPNGNWGFITERFANFLAMHVLGRPK